MPNEYRMQNAKERSRSRTTEFDATSRRSGNRREAGSRAGMPIYLSGSKRSATANFGTILDRREEEGEKAETGAAQNVEENAVIRNPGVGEPGLETVPTTGQSVSPISPISGEGLEHQSVAYGLALRGRTDATFNSSFRTLNTRTTPGTGCDGCTGADCVHVSGTLESTFRVATQVTLPRVSDFPDLTPCQRQRVQDAITNVLAPHEQEHVAAFNTYNGTIRTPFDLNLCRADFDSRIQALHDSAESARQSSAQAASDALDPFEFEVDLNCEDRRSTGSLPPQSEADTSPPDSTEPPDQ